VLGCGQPVGGTPWQSDVERYLGRLEKPTLFLSKSGRDPTAMGQRRLTQDKCLSKRKSAHGYSYSTGIEVIQETLCFP